MVTRSACWHRRLRQLLVCTRRSCWTFCLWSLWWRACCAPTWRIRWASWSPKWSSWTMASRWRPGWMSTVGWIALAESSSTCSTCCCCCCLPSQAEPNRLLFLFSPRNNSFIRSVFKKFDFVLVVAYCLLPLRLLLLPLTTSWSWACWTSRCPCQRLRLLCRPVAILLADLERRPATCSRVVPSFFLSLILLSKYIWWRKKQTKLISRIPWVARRAGVQPGSWGDVWSRRRQWTATAAASTWPAWTTCSRCTWTTSCHARLPTALSLPPRVPSSPPGPTVQHQSRNQCLLSARRHSVIRSSLTWRSSSSSSSSDKCPCGTKKPSSSSSSTVSSSSSSPESTILSPSGSSSHSSSEFTS